MLPAEDSAPFNMALLTFQKSATSHMGTDHSNRDSFHVLPVQATGSHRRCGREAIKVEGTVQVQASFLFNSHIAHLCSLPVAQPLHVGSITSCDTRIQKTQFKLKDACKSFCTC